MLLALPGCINLWFSTEIPYCSEIFWMQLDHSRDVLDCVKCDVQTFDGVVRGARKHTPKKLVYKQSGLAVPSAL